MDDRKGRYGHGGQRIFARGRKSEQRGRKEDGVMIIGERVLLEA